MTAHSSKPLRLLARTGPDQDLLETLTRRPLSLDLVRRLAALTRPHARIRNILIILVLIRAIQLPVLAWFLGQVINGPIARADRPLIWAGAIAFGLLALATDTLFYFRIHTAMIFGERFIFDLRQSVFAHMLEMPMAYFHKSRLGSLISRLTSDIESIRSCVQNVFFIGLVQGGQMLVAAAIMFWYDQVLFLVVLAMAPVFFFTNRHFLEIISARMRRLLESWSRVTANIAESVSGVRVTQSFVRQEENAGLFYNLLSTHSQYNAGVAYAAAGLQSILEFSSQAFLAALLVVAGYRTLGSPPFMPIGDLVQFFFLAHLFFGPIQNLAMLYNQALTAMAGSERVFKVLDTAPEWRDDPDAREDVAIRGRIEFQNVTFGYTPAHPVLHDISFTVEAGRSIALVGHTGSGKSTIINLVAKFYLPSHGTVLVDGLDIRRISSACLHRQMGIVLQQNFLFSGSVMDNIRVGHPGASDEEVVEAARSLGVLDIIEGLPAGFQTEVGEKGASLSLGQRQVVCFARAVLANPRILILDEATSSVDSRTEARLQKALARLLQGRTSFVIAHRLSTVRHAATVLVLEKGRIIERGPHAQLLSAGGPYSRLYKQFVSGR